ncbi:hypothetical protein [Streptomyces sp. NBC_00859]|uniref:hypothetical protein n=1 Tax=Streptomyces sp. NBC_00859 TaxID=2903682 RepID=UPI0038669E1E|nr:hypothetical protein OG584_26040 [Streptomyces sp. NBC_00859]
MAVFACTGCGAVLTAPVSRVALPVHAHHRHGHTLLPPLMEPGTYAVDQEPSGPPWLPWSEARTDEAETRGFFAPVDVLPMGPPGEVVVAPGDSRGTVLIPERCDGCCMGLDGRDGPNLACAQCGQEVATRIDDCSLWQAVRFVPHAVHRHSAAVPVPCATGWATPPGQSRGAPPVGPSGAWSPLWEAAAGAALAHLLVVSAGMSVEVPGGLAAHIFGRSLDALLPKGPPVKRAALAGPGLPAPDSTPDIALVPRHPQTGEAWRPPGTSDTVPVEAGVWTRLAFPREGLPVPAAGGMPDGVFRDDPLPPHPWELFRPDPEVLLHTLARLPAVRQPWLREIYDRVRGNPYGHPFQ